MSVIQFKSREYAAKQFTASVDGKTWLFSGTLCGAVDMATPSGTWCMTPDEVLHVIAALQSAREDILQNSNPHTDPRIVEGTASCPFPIWDDDGTAKQCVQRGHCGCDELSKAKKP